MPDSVMPHTRENQQIAPLREQVSLIDIYPFNTSNVQEPRRMTT